MRIKPPQFIMRNCDHCKKEFAAKRKGISYTMFCDECKANRVWIPGKEGYKPYE